MNSPTKYLNMIGSAVRMQLEQQFIFVLLEVPAHLGTQLRSNRSSLRSRKTHHHDFTCVHDGMKIVIMTKIIINGESTR